MAKNASLNVLRYFYLLMKSIRGKGRNAVAKKKKGKKKKR